MNSPYRFKPGLLKREEYIPITAASSTVKEPDYTKDYDNNQEKAIQADNNEESYKVIFHKKQLIQSGATLKSKDTNSVNQNTSKVNQKQKQTNKNSKFSTSPKKDKNSKNHQLSSSSSSSTSSTSYVSVSSSISSNSSNNKRITQSSSSSSSFSKRGSSSSSSSIRSSLIQPSNPLETIRPPPLQRPPSPSKQSQKESSSSSLPTTSKDKLSLSKQRLNTQERQDKYFKMTLRNPDVSSYTPQAHPPAPFTPTPRKLSWADTLSQQQGSQFRSSSVDITSRSRGFGNTQGNIYDLNIQTDRTRGTLSQAISTQRSSIHTFRSNNSGWDQIGMGGSLTARSSFSEVSSNSKTKKIKRDLTIPLPRETYRYSSSLSFSTPRGIQQNPGMNSGSLSARSTFTGGMDYNQDATYTMPAEVIGQALYTQGEAIFAGYLSARQNQKREMDSLGVSQGMANNINYFDNRNKITNSSGLYTLVS